MIERLNTLPKNPFLPEISERLDSNHTRRLRHECAHQYHIACLELSQSYWLQKKQAQAILQLNKAFMADIRVMGPYAPYAALKWYLENRDFHHFLGNPVRHFQHLATRMSGPRSELRSWRAWACFTIAQLVLPDSNFPVDSEQLVGEQIKIPNISEIIENLDSFGVVNELESFLSELQTTRALLKAEPNIGAYS